MDINRFYKNFFITIDSNGISFEFEKLAQLKYWDKIIDKLKSKRDLCERKAKLITANSGISYYLPNKRWLKINKTLDNAYRKRREQIMSACYSIANWIAKNYDYAAIGDYTPNLSAANENAMHRSILNQEVIGESR